MTMPMITSNSPHPMKLVGIKDYVFIKAASDGVVLLSFYKSDKIIQFHANNLKAGWNSITFLSDAWKNATYVDATFYKAAVPSNIQQHLGGSPIIPLSDQDDLKPGVDDLGSELEPDDRTKPEKHRLVRIIDADLTSSRDKSSDPFLFSEPYLQPRPRV